MARGDWYYPNISLEMAATLDYIVNKEGKKYGIHDKGQLIRVVLGDFISKYEEHKNIRIARKFIRGPNDKDFMQPLN